jgi:putative transposase
MDFVANNVYHIYNRGNNHQTIFLKERNYIYFLEKVRKYISPQCDILAWVLMPNHFHFLIHANEATTQMIGTTIKRSALSEGFRLLLSSYSKGINKQEGFSGNLIKQNTRSKCVYNTVEDTVNYTGTCFTYIHQNPVRAGLVNEMDKWEYSSYKDYARLRNGDLCNLELAARLMDNSILHTKATRIIGEDGLKNIW